MKIRFLIHDYLAAIKWAFIHTIDSIYWLFQNDPIVVTCWINQFCGRVSPHNFGDDINVPLIESLTGRRVRAYKTLLKKNQENLICIGSMIDNHSNPYAIIWGGGILYGNRELVNGSPKKVFAVRGEKTRAFLLSKGVDCPKVYGDPALLMPLIYKPNVKRMHKFGLIPHFLDYNLAHLQQFAKKHNECILIDLVHYKTWQSVIDVICSCEMVVSSSLHGMIVSDAYGIPNIRVKFSELINGGDFKYIDYCSGVNRDYFAPLDYTKEIDLSIAECLLKKYKPIAFDYRPLLKAFPYKLVDKYNQI